MFLTASAQSFALKHYFMCCFVTGLSLRCAVIAAIYSKVLPSRSQNTEKLQLSFVTFCFQSLLLNNSSRKGSTLGEITNLKFVDNTGQFNLVWSAPLQMVVALFFLWRTVGPSVLAGVVVMVLLIPVNAVIEKKSGNFQMRQMKEMDSRMKLINGIKVTCLLSHTHLVKSRIKINALLWFCRC